MKQDFVITPVDKSNENIDPVCKRFYASVIAKELGLNNN